MAMRRFRSSGGLALGGIAAALIVGAVLRVWRLDTPRAWLDEAVTVLVAAGRGPDAMPMQRIAPLSVFRDIYDSQVTASARDVLAVYHDPRVQDLHPPTYHLLSNGMLRSGIRRSAPLVARVRVLGVAFGILSIAAIYVAARQAFDRRTATAAAWLIAVSPLTVMLSREARNYSLVILLVTLGTGATLAIAQRIDERRGTMAWWAVWTLCSAASLYVHYFALFAWVGQVGALVVVALRTRSRSALLGLVAAAAIVGVLSLPLAPLLLAQAASPEQRWLTFDVYGSTWFEAPYRVASAWQTMLLGKAWNLGEPVYTITRTWNLAAFLAVIAAAAWSLARMPGRSAERRAVQLLLIVVAITVFAFMAAMAMREKDYVSEVRYQVVYYPALAIVLASAFTRFRPRALAALVLLGAISSVMVDLDVESWKGSDPIANAGRIETANRPALIVAGVASYNEAVVHSVNFLELFDRTGGDGWSVVFVPRTEAYASLDRHADPRKFWAALTAVRPETPPASLVVHSANMLPSEYLRTVTLVSARGEPISCAGLALDDPDHLLDNFMMHTAYRRYACTTGAAAATR
jgi:uncharacterized membrane protein